MTTRQEIAHWLEAGRTGDNTHMIVVCDNFDFEDYPVYVPKGKNVRNVFAEYDNKNMQIVMEVYSYRKNLEQQLNQQRAFEFD
jgi:hypothetical protein